MNIYIYGSSSFKKQMHNALVHSNVKIRLNSEDKIIDIDKLDDLKSAIALNPDDIYLIDQEKIVNENNTIGSKIGFLKPKDAVEKSFLELHGIGDLQFKSIDEVGKQVNAKLDRIKHEAELRNISNEDNPEVSTDEFQMFAKDELENLIWSDTESIDIDKFRESLSSINEIDPEIFGSRNNDFELDEDLSKLLLPDDETDKDELQNITHEEIENFDEPFEEIDLDEIYGKENELDVADKLDDLLPIKNQPEDNMMFNNTNMFDGLDMISQDEMAKAFDGIASIDSGPKFESSMVTQTPQNTNLQPQIEGALASEIAVLIQQLLKNKTIEITIKIKD